VTSLFDAELELERHQSANKSLPSKSPWKACKCAHTEVIQVDGFDYNQKLLGKDATRAVIFNPSDYCPYSNFCLSFLPHARGNSRCKGVQSHISKLHSDITYYLVPCE